MSKKHKTTLLFYKAFYQIIPMNDTYGKLKDLGMKIQDVSKIDSKGRVVIPFDIRNKNKVEKYFICTFEDMIILRGV